MSTKNERKPPSQVSRNCGEPSHLLRWAFQSHAPVSHSEKSLTRQARPERNLSFDLPQCLLLVEWVFAHISLGKVTEQLDVWQNIIAVVSEQNYSPSARERRERDGGGRGWEPIMPGDLKPPTRLHLLKVLLDPNSTILRASLHHQHTGIGWPFQI